ncbi:dihydrolipoamide dehydrogenase [Nocardioides sp. CF8]|nr:dihydrolipoamide dehydrogenase [Nocardioides sp. CF8]
MAGFELEAVLLVLRVCLDGLGTSEVEHDRWCVACDGHCHGPVDGPDHSRGEVARDDGDLAGDPWLALERHHDGEGEGEPVAQVEDVGDRGPGRGVVGLAGEGELGDGVFAQRRRPVAAGLDHLLPRVRGEVGVVHRRVGVQVGPVCDHQEVLDLREPPSARRRLRQGQGDIGVAGIEPSPGNGTQGGVDRGGDHVSL